MWAIFAHRDVPFFMDFIFYQLRVRSFLRGWLPCNFPACNSCHYNRLISVASFFFYCSAAFICHWGDLINWQLCSCECFMALNGRRNARNNNISSKLSLLFLYISVSLFNDQKYAVILQRKTFKSYKKTKAFYTEKIDWDWSFLAKST